ncbi:sensor histidine kinase [Spirochaeta lutea]|nr:sensor histidine kinase [Spirochaeta lutea]
MDHRKQSIRSAIRVVGIYAALGSLWILFSDRITQVLFQDPELFLQAQTIKGWLYVLTTAGLLYVLIHNELGIQRRHNEETKALSRELHHRVKNNLQLMLSLINLQQDQYRESPETSKALGEMYLRMESISLIHEQMYQVRSLASVKLKPYLEELSASIASHYALGNTLGSPVELAIDDYEPHITEALPIGLMVNEFIASAVRRHISNPGDIRITIENQEQAGYIWIAVFLQTQEEELFSNHPENRLSETLIQSLASQLGGTWTKNQGDSALVYELRFKRQTDQLPRQRA